MIKTTEYQILLHKRGKKETSSCSVHNPPFSNKNKYKDSFRTTFLIALLANGKVGDIEIDKKCFIDSPLRELHSPYRASGKSQGGIRQAPSKMLESWTTCSAKIKTGVKNVY